MNNKNEKMICAWLPDRFVTKFKDFVKKKKEEAEIEKISIRTVVYSALKEYMDKNDN